MIASRARTRAAWLNAFDDSLSFTRTVPCGMLLSEVRKARRLPRNLHVDVHKALRLPCSPEKAFKARALPKTTSR